MYVTFLLLFTVLVVVMVLGFFLAGKLSLVRFWTYWLILCLILTYVAATGSPV